MSSNEEYLDSLLKAIMEGNTSEEASPSVVQDTMEADSEQGASTWQEPEAMIDTDNIEAMFASVGAETVEDETQEATLAGDELALDDGMLLSELPVDEGTMSDKHVVREETLADELAMDDEAITDDFGLIETAADDFAQEESVEESIAADDLSPDELGLGDLGLERLGEIEQDEPGTGNNFALEDEFEVGDNFALDDAAEKGDDFALEDVTEEDDDFMLGNVAEGDNDFALEETGEEDEDLTALLASMDADDDLSEINDLLEKSDQGVVVDDDIMAMLGDVSSDDEDDASFDFLSIDGNPEDIREITPEELEERGGRKARQQRKKAEKERKKREKLAKKAKKKNASQDTNAGEEDADDLNNLLTSRDEAGDKQKKKGTFGKLLDFLLEEDEEEGDSSGGSSDNGGSGLASLSDENKELLAELQAEDKKNAKKKDKKEKKAKKNKKEKGGEKAEAKPKKPKKEKKKKEKIEEEPQVPEKKLSKKKVISVFVFCASLAACIAVVTILMPEQLEKQEARVAFDQNQYTQVYELLHGKKLSEEDEVLLQKSGTILKLQRKLDSYKNYERMNMPLEALNALLEGVSRYQYLVDDAELYNVSGEMLDIYGKILDTLAYNYGLTEADALDIIASEDDVTYSKRIQAVISGESFGADEPAALPEGKQDVLPEEEEIIDRLEDTELEDVETENAETENVETEDTEME